MRQILIAVVISAGMLAGCSSGSPVVPDAEPKVVGTFCALPFENGDLLWTVPVHHRLYDDGSSEVMVRDFLAANGRPVFYVC